MTKSLDRIPNKPFGPEDISFARSLSLKESPVCINSKGVSAKRGDVRYTVFPTDSP
jgi:hypothetical protein